MNKGKVFKFIANFCIVAMAISCGVWLYNMIGPRDGMLEDVSLAVESIFVLILLVLLMTRKKWDK
jgi:hypothetical protein